MFIITRGAKLDMGPGLSHKTIIIDYYLKSYTFTEIEKITNHSERSVSPSFVKLMLSPYFAMNRFLIGHYNRIFNISYFLFGLNFIFSFS
ncbi:MAG: DUF1670 domain-containing protein, partial [Proteobacteria bacterium]|nr:DUF1670 domain-containing protein [Pseudomonadota bacterium]